MPVHFKAKANLLDHFRDPDTGRAVRPVQMDHLPVPEAVDLHRNRLKFTWYRHPKTTAVPRALLESFLGLTGDRAFLGFARLFGCLGLPNDGSDQFNDELIRVHSAYEPLDEWRRVQRLFRAMLALAISLREEKRPSVEALKALDAAGGIVLEADPSSQQWLAQPAEMQRWGAELVLAAQVQILAAECDLTPALAVLPTAAGHSTQFDFVFQDLLGKKLSPSPLGGLSLFGALVIQLIASLTGTGFAVCSACGNPYVPKRRPQLYRRHYCRACGRQAALRDAKIAYRARLRKKQTKGIRRTR